VKQDLICRGLLPKEMDDEKRRKPKKSRDLKKITDKGYLYRDAPKARVGMQSYLVQQYDKLEKCAMHCLYSPRHL